MIELLTWENAVALLTLSAMEIVLGIDNIVFITILVGRLPEEKRARIRTIGLVLALVLRIGLLFGITWIMGLTRPLFTVLDAVYIDTKEKRSIVFRNYNDGLELV